MLAHYCTKPLMVERLCELGNFFMGYNFIFYLVTSILHSIKEYVGKPSKKEKEKSQKCVIELS